jgi:DNA-binding transcriptional ArsR family regulator
MQASANAVIPIAATVAKLIRLLGSDRDGEVVASAHALRRVLAGAGLTLHDLAQAIERPPMPSIVPYSDHADNDWREMVERCRARWHLLSDRERGLIVSLARWRGEPTNKQLAWLETIHERVA